MSDNAKDIQAYEIDFQDGARIERVTGSSLITRGSCRVGIITLSGFNSKGYITVYDGVNAAGRAIIDISTPVDMTASVDLLYKVRFVQGIYIAFSVDIGSCSVAYFIEP